MSKHVSEGFGMVHIAPSFKIEEVLKACEHCGDDDIKCSREESTWYSEELTPTKRKVIDDGVEAILFGGLLHAASRSFDTLVVQGTAAAEHVSRTSSQKRGKNSSMGNKGGSLTQHPPPWSGAGLAQAVPGPGPGHPWSLVPAPPSNVDQLRMASSFVGGEGMGGVQNPSYHPNIQHPGAHVAGYAEPYSGSVTSAYTSEHRGRHEQYEHPAHSMGYPPAVNELGQRTKHDHGGRSRESFGSIEREWQRRKDGNKHYPNHSRHSASDSQNESRHGKDHVRRGKMRSRSQDDERNIGHRERRNSDGNKHRSESWSNDGRKISRDENKRKYSNSPSRSSNRNANSHRIRSDESSVVSYTSSSSSRTESSYEDKRGRRRYRRNRRSSPERRRSRSSSRNNRQHKTSIPNKKSDSSERLPPTEIAGNATARGTMANKTEDETQGPQSSIHGELQNPRNQNNGKASFDGHEVRENKGKSDQNRSSNNKRKDRTSEKGRRHSGHSNGSRRQQRRRKRSVVSEHG